MNAFQYKFQIIQNRNHCTAEQDSAKWEKKNHNNEHKTKITTLAVQNGKNCTTIVQKPK